MARSDNLELDGVVIKALPGTRFEVDVTAGSTTRKVTCTISGRLRQNYIKIIPGDLVTVQISPYDFNNGIITWRKK